MHVYENGVTEWFVAESEADAKLAAMEFNAKGPQIPAEELDLDFVQTPDDKALTMETDDPGVLCGRGRNKVTKTAAEWAATSPRGFLMTTEY